MLSKKYYKEIAKILGEHRASNEMIAEFDRMLLKDNPRFDEGRFLDAIVIARHAKKEEVI
jgi:hypothetical protein